MAWLAQIWTSQIFLASFTFTSSEKSFQAIILYNLKENYWMKVEKMAKNLFWAWFWPFLTQIWSPIFFTWVLPLLDVIHCYKLSLYTISRKTYEPNLRKWQKNLVSGPILAPLAQIWAPKTFFTSTRRKTLLLAITVCNFKEN